MSQPLTLGVSRQLWPVLSGLAVALIWAGWITISRWGIQQNLTAADITLLRFGTAAVVTIPLLFYVDWKAVSLWRVVLVGLGCGFPYTMLSFYGLTSIPAANAGVLVNGLLPIISVVLGWFWLKEAPLKSRWLGLGIIVAANVCMLAVGLTKASLTVDWLFLVAAALVLSFYMTAVRVWQVPLLTIMVAVPWVNSLLFLPIWFFSESHFEQASMAEILIQLGYQGILVSVCGLWLISFCVKRLGPVTGSVIMGLVPAITAVLGVIVLSETLQLLEWVGVISCTVGLIHFAKSK